MACLLDLAGKILDPIIDIVVRKVVRHIGYIFRYKQNVEELQEKKKNLEEKMGKIREKVEAAKTRGDIVKENVKVWTSNAEKKKSEVEDLVDDKAKNENMKCLKFSCPNLCSRYRMGKQAEAKKDDLEKHIQGVNSEEVADRQPPPSELQFISTGNFMNFDSREKLLKLIEDKLMSGDRKYNVIGVHGAGGIGKTTTVEEVGKQLKGRVFDDVVKGVVSQDVKIHEIQGDLADQLSLSFVSNTEWGRRGELWNRLNNGKNNLVILDDLWKKVELKEIGIPLREEGKGCKVILTTRNREVLKDMEVGEYIPFEVLSKGEAWSLFEKKVGVTFDSDEFYNVAKSVCKKCNGLPVAILAVGGALMHETDMQFWEGMLDQLQNSSWKNIDGLDEMYASLKCSYDCLGEEAKSILLLCCLYPEDYNIPVDFLLWHCIARRMLPDMETVHQARNRIIYSVRSLKNRSLLLDGKDKNHVKMHDVIRDVVILIAKTDKQYLVKNISDYWRVESINENLSAISVCLNKPKEVPNELVCPRIHTLRIECKDSSFQFPNNFFSRVAEIKVLELKGICMSSTPSSLANLSELRTLILIDCQLEDMSFLKGLKSNLEVLVIVDSDIKALPMELGELSDLRVLLLINCYGLKLIPAGVISKLTHLEELCLPNAFNVCEEFSGRESEDIEISRATLSELSSMTRLTNLCVFIPDVTLIPDLNFGNLVGYRIAVGKPFSLHDLFKHDLFKHDLIKERNLKLDGITYHDKIVALLEGAEVLFLYSVKGLKNALLNKECSSNSFSKLTTLEVTNCSFKFLFTSSRAKGLQQLQTLEIRDCDILEEIVGTEGEKDEQDHFNFSKLKELHLRNLPKLKSFGPKTKEKATVEGDSLPKGQSLFNEKVLFPTLEELDIFRLPNITEIWDKQVLPTNSFPHLATVLVSRCKKLVTVFPSNLWAQSLRKVWVGGCKGVTVVFSITGLEEIEDANNCSNFPLLRDVTLFKLENLNAFYGNSTGSKPQSLFDTQVVLPALKILNISSLPNITEIWDKQVLPTNSFPHLANVWVYGCEKLVTVFPSILWAGSLRNVTIGSCKGVTVVFSITRLEKSEDSNNCSMNFPQLRYVRLNNLENLNAFCGNSTGSKPQSLFNPRDLFPALEEIEVKDLLNIEVFKQQLSKGEVKFPTLRKLRIGGANMDYLAPQVLE